RVPGHVLVLALSVMLEHQLAALRDQQRMQAAHLAALLGRSEALPEIVRRRRRNGAACDGGHDGGSHSPNEMTGLKIKSVNRVLLGLEGWCCGQIRPCSSESSRKRWRTAPSRRRTKPSASSM